MDVEGSFKRREEWTVCWKCGETEKRVRLGLLECGHVLCSGCVIDETAQGAGFRCPIPACNTLSKWHDIRGSNFVPEIRDLLADDDTVVEQFEEGICLSMERLKRQLVFASRHRIARQKQCERRLEAWKRYREKVSVQINGMKQQFAAMQKKCTELNESRNKLITAYKAQGAALMSERENARQLKETVHKLSKEKYRSREVITPSPFRLPIKEASMRTPSSIQSFRNKNFPPTPAPPEGPTPMYGYGGGNRNNSYNAQFVGRDDRIRKSPLVVHQRRGNGQPRNPTHRLH